MKRTSTFKKFLTGILLAQGSVDVGEMIPPGWQNLSELPQIVKLIFNIMFGGAGLVAVFYLVYGGYLYITSGGGEQAENAKKTILNAIIGLVVILIAFAIVNFLWKYFTGHEYEMEQLEGTL
ncbi:hypothetical protein J7L13_03590 [bacterium]|nr:hypothetical protein [bacterium]